MPRVGTEIERRGNDRDLAAAVVKVVAAILAAIVVAEQQDNDDEENPGAVIPTKQTVDTHFLSPPFIAYNPYYVGEGELATTLFLLTGGIFGPAVAYAKCRSAMATIYNGRGEALNR